MDAFYHNIVVGLGLSPVNTSLLAVIFFLARQRFSYFKEEIVKVAKKNDRVERSLIKAGIELLDMEE